MANLEALWVAGQLNPGKKIVASDQSHYTHKRISAVLQLPFAHVPTDNRGRMDPIALEKMLAAGDVGCVVATEGTTGTGSVDPLPEILRLRDRYGFRLHVDAAYGGYFTLASNLAAETRASFDLIGRADSIVIDPHKHGLQPYGCGCVLFRDPAGRRDLQTRIAVHLFHFFGSSSRRNQPGMFAPRRFRRRAVGHATPAAAGAGRGIRRPCSKPRATQQCNSRNVSQMTSAGCCRSRHELDIVVWAPRAKSIAEISALSQRIFDAAAKQNLHLALIRVPIKFFSAQHNLQASATDTVLCLRSVLMKPEHRDWLDRIYTILSRVADDLLNH